MALRKETITANEALSTLTDDQVVLITALSKADEDTAFKTHTSNLYNQLDSRVNEITGLSKSGDEKSYDFVARALNTLKTNASEADTYKSQVDALSQEKARLEGEIAKGSTDVATKKLLEQANLDLANIKGEYTKLKENTEKEKQVYEAKISDVMLTSELMLQSAGLPERSDLPVTAVEVLKKQAFQAVKALNPTYVEDTAGNKRLVFKNADGATIVDPDNMEAMPASKLIAKEFERLGLLKEVRTQGGGGTKSPKTAGGTTLTASTKQEAQEQIHQILMAKGVRQYSDEYNSQKTKLWIENKVSELPEK